MLQPGSRLTLIDAMRPPAGFTLDAAMAVTFTLDLRALLAAPAAFALAGSEGVTKDGTGQEPIELLHAVKSNASKLTVFSQVGEIGLPPSRPVFAFLEQAVVPVLAPRGGVVHPKVWVMRYAPSAQDGSAPRLRVLIASRNLTFDASWDTVVRLDESIAGKGADLSPLSDLFEGLLAQKAGASPSHHARVEHLSAALRAAKFALPVGVKSMNLSVLGLENTDSPLPLDADRSLIISPFLSTDFFTDVRPGRVDAVVSRPESLDGLDAAVLPQLGVTYQFDDGSIFDPDDDDKRSSQDPARPITGLHAKVFAFEQGSTARLFLGSANATSAAFTSNVEVLLELKGSVEQLGIDQLFGGSDDEPGLNALFMPYTPISGQGPDPGLGGLDGARRAVARIDIEGVVEASGAGFAVTYRSVEPVPTVEDITIECWPLSSPGNRRTVAMGEPLELRFETTVELISGFLAFCITHADGTITEFVVPSQLSNVPEERDSLLLKALVGNAERFLQYLLALLDEDPARADLLDAVEVAYTGEATNGDHTPVLPVLEKLIRTMRRDPAKLASLQPLVADLAADNALPPGFHDLWATITEVALPEGSS